MDSGHKDELHPGTSSQNVNEDFSQPNIDVENITDRKVLIPYACDLTLDPNTVNGWITLSDDNKRATCGEWRNYPDCPERFDSHPQVLCTDGLTGRCYWEVEWSNGYRTDVGVAVTYKRIERKGNGYSSELGENDVSWYFEVYGGKLQAWHNGRVWSSPIPSSGCSVVGVLLDWPAGTLSFYDASSPDHMLNHLYTFHAKFAEPVYPGFYIYYKSNFVYLCPLKEN